MLPSISSHERWLSSSRRRACAALPLLLCAAMAAEAGVLESYKISATSGGLSGPLEDFDRFGSSVIALGDLDGDGNSELAVGVPLDDTGGTDRGAVWILFLNANGTVRSEAKIADGLGFSGLLSDGDAFGAALAAPGDLDADGVPDLIVGAPFDDDAAQDGGAIWILLLDATGTARQHWKLDAGALSVTAAPFDFFGRSLAVLGNLDGEDAAELLIGSPGDDEFGLDRGAAWIVGLSSTGVEWSRRIGDDSEVLKNELADGDGFGSSVASLRVQPGAQARIVVGAPYDDDGGSDRGSIWLLTLDAQGTVSLEQKISELAEDSDPDLDDRGLFGSSLATIETSSEGATIAVGAIGDPGAGREYRGGSLWILALDPSDSLVGASRLSAGEGGFEGPLDAGDAFGSSVSVLELDGVDPVALVVGTPGDDDGGPDHGAAWVLFRDASGAIVEQQKISDLEGGFAGGLLARDEFGSALAAPGDLNGDGYEELLVGAPGDDGLGEDRGAMWVISLRPDGTVHDQAKWDPGQLGPSTELADGDRFASAIASFDLSVSGGDPMLAIGAPGDDGGEIVNGGAVWLARLSVGGEIATAWKISALDPPLSQIVPASAFGSSVASMGDLDGDGLTELAVGAPVDEAVWIVFLDAMDGVKDAWPIKVGSAGFGSAVTSVEDLDGDGRRELVVGAPQDGSDFLSGGALWLLFLNSGGSVLRQVKLNSAEGGFPAGPRAGDHFGSSVAAIGDLDLDGIPELAVGARRDDQLGTQRGSVWLLSLNADGRVRSHEKIFDGERRAPSTSYFFGSSVTALPDLNADGVADLAVGAIGADDGAENAGATWLLALDGAVSPRLLHASATSRTSLRLGFSERLLAASAEIESAYDVAALSDAGSSIPVLAAGLQPDGTTVHLVLADSLMESRYRVVASGIVDEAGTPLASDGSSAELTVPPASFQISIPTMEYRGFGLSLLPYDPNPSWIFRTLGDRDFDRGWRASHWSPKDSVYVQVGSAQWPLDEIVPGQGYWVISSAQEVLQVGGFPMPERPYSIPLFGGSGDPEPPAWNQIANPFPFPVLVGDLKVTDGSRTVALTAPDNELSSRYLLDGSTGQYVELGAAQCLRTNTAYWIEKIAEGPVQLIVPASPVEEGACTSSPEQLSLPPQAEWVAMLTATQGTQRSQTLFIGAGRDLGQAQQLLARAAPPPPGAAIPALYVEETSRGRLNGRYTKIFRDAALPMDWQVCLETPVVPGQVRLEVSAIGLDNVPMSWQDPLTGSVLNIASESVWTLAAARSPRCYVLQIGPPRDAQAEISSGVWMRPPSPNPFVQSTGFFFNVQGPAEIRANVYDLAGRHVRTLSSRTTSAGESVLVWDGNDVRGRPVASGIYLVRQRIDDEAERTFRVAKLR